MLKDEAIGLSKLVENTFTPEPLTPEELRSHRALVVPEGESLCFLLSPKEDGSRCSRQIGMLTFLCPLPTGKFLRRIPVGNPENSNSAIEQFTYIGDIYNDLERAKLSVLATIVQEPLFDDLRAKQQLGYIVRTSTDSLRRTDDLTLYVRRSRRVRVVPSPSWVFASSCKVRRTPPSSRVASMHSGRSSSRPWPR